MTGVAWLTRYVGDVPDGDGWLSARERAVLGGLRLAKRRDDWRLGRWTAKAAVAGFLGIPARRVEIIAAPDGAPEAHVDGAPAAVSISLSHRVGVSIATVAHDGAVVGCDLELVEPRSAAFVGEWLAPGEQARVAAAHNGDRACLVNAIWCAKEAASKVRRAGLRLDLRKAEVGLDGDALAGGWGGLSVAFRDEGLRMSGWWRPPWRTRSR